MTKPVQKTIKGGRAAFFDSADTDRLLSMLMKLMSEHWALRERVLALETLLAEKNILPADAMESFVPTGSQDASWDQESFAFIQSVIEAAQNVDNRHRDP